MSDNQGKGAGAGRGQGQGSGTPGGAGRTPGQGQGAMPGMSGQSQAQGAGAQGQPGKQALGREMPTQSMQGGPRLEKPRSSRQAFARLMGYLGPHKAAIAGVIALVVASTALALLGPYLVGVAIDRYISTKDLPGIWRITALLFATYTLYWLTEYGQSYQIVAVTQRLLRALRRDLFGHLQALSLRFFDQRTTGELMSRLTNDIDAVNRVLSQSVVQLVSSGLTLVGMVVVVLLLNVWLALGTIAVMPLMLFFTLRMGHGTRRGFREVQGNLGRLNALIEETISGVRVVQAFRRERTITAEFERANVAVRDTTIRAQLMMTLLRPMLMVFSNLDLVVIAGLGGWLAIQGQVSVGVIATFILYARRFFEPLLTLADLYNSIQSALAGAERVFDTLDEVPEVADRPGAAALSNIRGHVTFDHVHFSYVPGVPVLKDVSLEALPGQVVALVGPTGAGKTTVVNLLSRFYDVDQGALLIDGRDIRDVQQDSLRQQLGIVLQDTFLFSDTVMENIRYGRLEATDEECIEAARLANADQFIQRLPEGYETPLSERASTLSQGQRQLLAIARAILSDPRILILDEATSSVDTRTEVHIQQALLNLMKGRTSFVIAHRLSTIRNADQLLVIDDGRIIERGTHDSLLAAGGFYHRLYMSQFARAEAVHGIGTALPTTPAAGTMPA
ncbi:MAG: ABC transporter ATP-binding protein [Anaerolineae bacterium]